MTTLRSACPLDCPDGCTLEVEVVDGRLVKVGAPPIDADDATVNPLTQGFICQKVKRHHERVYAPERVLTPLVRTGPKGAGEFRPATWDEALDLVAAHLRDALADDPASVVPYLYNSSVGEIGGGLLGPLLWDALGVSSVPHTICAATASRAWELTFGSMPGADLLDVVHAGLVVVWGANPTISNTHLPPLVDQARRGGAPLVVVDPRRTAMARRADLHLAVRPGTDVVLAMAVARALAACDGIDRGFVGAHAEGIEELLAACEAWTIDRAAAECGVDAPDIEAFVALLTTRRPAFWRLGWGMERNRNGGSAVRAALALPVLCGSFGQVGAGVHLHSGHDLPWSAAALADAVHGPVGEPGALPRGQVRRVANQNRLGALLTDPGDEAPVRVLVVQGSNPAAMTSAQVKVLAGLARDDLFTVVHDQVMTDTARFADVVLPATTHFEARDLTVSYGAFAVQGMAPVIERVGQSRTNDEVTAGIAARLGLAAGPGEAFDPDPARVMAVALPQGPGERASVQEPGSAVQFRDIWPDTPDRRARLVADEPDAARVPQYAALSSRYPLALVSPASNRTINSILGEAGRSSATLHVHPDDAAERGIVDGQVVRVWNDDAEISVPAVIDADLRPGVVAMPKGLWLSSTEAGLTANAFTPDTLSDLADGACYNDARVEVGHPLRSAADAPWGAEG